MPKRLTRQQSNERSLERLGVERCLAFLRAARGEDGPLAVQLINDSLDAGADLRAELLDDDEYGYHLDVHAHRGRRFTIGFGCVPGPMVGDGGEWEVEFDPSGAVTILPEGKIWIS